MASSSLSRQEPIPIPLFSGIEFLQSTQSLATTHKSVWANLKFPSRIVSVRSFFAHAHISFLMDCLSKHVSVPQGTQGSKKEAGKKKANVPSKWSEFQVWFLASLQRAGAIM